jgi:hypothetical protein
VDKVKDKSIKRGTDTPFALRRDTIGQVTTALDAVQSPSRNRGARRPAGGGVPVRQEAGWLRWRE